MAQTQQRESLVIKPPGRLVYTNALLAPVAFRDPETGAMGNPRFNVQILIEKTHPLVNEIKAAILKAAGEDLPGRDVRTLRLPFKDGDAYLAELTALGKTKRDFYDGHWVLFAQKPEKSRAGTVLTPPRLSIMQNGKPVDYSDGAMRGLAKDAFYNGVRAAVSVQFKGYSGFGGGVTCYLDRLMSLNVGDRIEVGFDDESVFGDADSYSEYLGHATAESPSAGMAAPQPNPW